MQLKRMWDDASNRGLQSSVDKILSDVNAARGSKSNHVRSIESSTQLAACKDYASKMLKLQVQTLRFVPLPRMPPIQIIPPDFPRYSAASEKNKVRRQSSSSHANSDSDQIFQPGTASKGSSLSALKSQGDRGKPGQRRSNPATLREACDLGRENGADVDDQDFSQSLSSRSSGATNSSAQSGIVLVLRDFMGCHTLDIINMATPQADSEDADDEDVYSDPKTSLLKEFKLIQAFFDSFASADEDARARCLESQGNYLVGSCKGIFRAASSIVADDAALVRDDIHNLALQLCDVLQMFSRDHKFCFALNFLLKALVKLHAVSPQLLDNLLIVSICMAQDSPVLLEQCSSPADLLFSKAYIQVRA